MLGISAKFLNITNTPKTSGDDPWWLRHRVTSHDYTRLTPDGPRSPKFTHRKSSYGVVMAGVTVALNMHVVHPRLIYRVTFPPQLNNIDYYCRMATHVSMTKNNLLPRRMPAYDTVLETYTTYAWHTTSVYQRIPAYTSVYQRMSDTFWYAGIR